MMYKIGEFNKPVGKTKMMDLLDDFEYLSLILKYEIIVF